MFTISVIVGSAVLYRDFESANAERVGKFIGGCTLTFLGVYFITSGRSSQEGTEDTFSREHQEQGINLLDEEQQDGGIEADRMPLEENTRENQRVESRRSSRYATTRPPNFERLGSGISDLTRPFTPPTPNADSPLIENPWVDPRENLQSRRFSSQNTTHSSMPGNTSEPATPRSGRPHLPATERPSASHRRSIADIFPGPISSPLSSSLSGVVANARRKELETSPKAGRPRLGLHKSTSSRVRPQPSEEHFQVSPSSPTPAIETVPSNPKSKRGRSHSLGNALGSFLRRYPKRTRDEEDGEDTTGETSNDGG